MNMALALSEGMHALGIDGITDQDGIDLLAWLVQHVSSEGAQVFAKEVSVTRRRAYMAEHMRHLREARRVAVGTAKEKNT